MTDPGQDLMRRIEAIDTAAADNARAAEAYRQVTEELAEVTGTATSADGVVTVVATADGGVSRVTFTGGVGDVAPEALSASVTHTIAQARYAAARQQAEVVRRGFGDTDLLDRVLDADERVFGDRRPADPGPSPEPQHVSQAPPPVRPGRRDRRPEPDDYSEFSYLRRGR
ncbi:MULTISPECIES: YbaB/EbfC family nucleoid-associated protein [Prauserella salsuginis group]|uniref:YbaB/EbfC family nucleoid-associated protein n=1 Tax=Prauserella salsuginis TaxID=387889 RepID=A0ABW6G566_9PSEU|nr:MULTISPECIES: YbaB/EbfC family nucleoid-associated protein [Prauserella salsuginis group]MCR3718907.1 YbaB/EbfC DNA-binding family protein [Prauserella flava]MCR3733477.1 YbaB/EbfC DNA-binding family protein [Prauserella salsuginis]